MNHLRDEVRIEACVEHVWTFVCDTSRWHDWDPRSDYSDFSGPVDEVGTTFVEATRLTIELDYEGLGRLPGFLSRPLVARAGRDIGHHFKALAEATSAEARV